MKSASIAIACLLIIGCSAKTAPAPTPAAGGPAVAVDDLRVTGPYVHENLAVFLIHAPAADDRDFLTLDEALKSGDVVVTEKQNEQVAELELENKGGRPVFIQEGDRVIGGKQDRIIGRSFVVPPRSGRMGVPSFCVEQGRWAGGEMRFAAGYSSQLAGKDVRLAAKCDSDQSEVWRKVADLKKESESLGASNTHTSLNETLENEKIKKLCEATAAALSGILDRHPDAVGVAIALNGKVEEVNVYPTHRLMAKLYGRIIQSYAVVAAVKKSTAAAPACTDVAQLMKEAAATKRSEKVAGNEFDLADGQKAYACRTKYQGRLIHAQWMVK